MVQEMTVTMASLSDLASHHHRHGHRSNKISKAPRGGKMVKPILKKLSTSSPKNSLDLDRGWEDQTVDLGYGSNGTYEPGRTSLSPSVRDMSFQFPSSASSWEPMGYGGAAARGGSASASASGTATPVGASGLDPPPAAHVGGAGGGVTSPTARSINMNLNLSLSRSRFQHARSTSATSHVSIGTNGSNHRPGASFVHPFQQTPRTNTPPLTYANSFTSFERDNTAGREYSPTIITENEDDDGFDHVGSASLTQSLTTSHLHKPPPSNSHSTSSLRRPSLASQRTSSLSDIRNQSSSCGPTAPPPLRVNTNPSFPRSVPAFSRVAHESHSAARSNSNSDLHLSISPSDSPRPSMQLTSPGNSSANAMSPLRTSLEGAFRLRSRSEVETGARHEDIREARRKFEEAERVKQEKYEAEQRRKQERKQERAAARKHTGVSEMSSMGRPSFSRRRSPPTVDARRVKSGGSAKQGPGAAINEKADGANTGIFGSNYESTADGGAPSLAQDVQDARFQTPARATSAKKKTQSYWTSFVLWFRTRLLRLGRRQTSI